MFSLGEKPLAKHLFISHTDLDLVSKGSQKLLVEGLPKDMEHIQIKNYFSKFGQIKNNELIDFHEGYCFIVFQDMKALSLASLERIQLFPCKDHDDTFIEIEVKIVDSRTKVKSVEKGNSKLLKKYSQYPWEKKREFLLSLRDHPLSKSMTITST